MLGAKSRDARIKAATSLLERIPIFMTLVGHIALSLRIFCRKRGSSCRRSEFISLARWRLKVFGRMGAWRLRLSFPTNMADITRPRLCVSDIAAVTRSTVLIAISESRIGFPQKRVDISQLFITSDDSRSCKDLKTFPTNDKRE
jgi:hypothetical protein